MKSLRIPLAAIVALTAPAWATSSIKRTAEHEYPGIVGERIDTCTLCHISTSPTTWNDYGNDLRAANLDFASIENNDSDGDGVSNIDEINALTFPGNAPDSVPGAEGEVAQKVPGCGEVPAQPGAQTGTAWVMLFTIALLAGWRLKRARSGS